MVESKIVPLKPGLILQGEKKHLIVTDLHIGFESNFASNEIFVGKNTSVNETITELKEIIDKVKPDSLVLLGDIKSSIKNITKNEWSDVPLFFEEMNKIIETILVPGNHDSNIGRLISGKTTLISSAGLVLENSLLTHGHTIPSENFAHVERIIMGHIHPVFFQEGSVLNGQRVWISIKADKQMIFPSQKGEIEITIIPSFNKYFYATHKRYYKKSISPIIERIKKVSSARVVTLDGSIIGDEHIIKNIL
jgi:putative SbcD/Mre11-related phosphoesterase